MGCGTEAHARWVPAHRLAPAPPILTERDWRGNAKADALATQALAAAQPPESLLAAALRADAEYKAAVHVGAAVLEAQLAWAHAGSDFACASKLGRGAQLQLILVYWVRRCSRGRVRSGLVGSTP